MKTNIDLKPEYLNIVKDILSQHLSQETVVWIFGSRVTGNAKPYSDIDLAIDAGKALSLDVLAHLSDAFVESTLPYKVDIVDWHGVSPDFQKIIEASRIKLLN